MPKKQKPLSETAQLLLHVMQAGAIVTYRYIPDKAFYHTSVGTEVLVSPDTLTELKNAGTIKQQSFDKAVYWVTYVAVEVKSETSNT
jgi:hypothetical protein